SQAKRAVVGFKLHSDLFGNAHQQMHPCAIMLQSTDRYVTTLDVNLHRVEKRLSLAPVVSCGAFARADKNVVAVPTLHLNAAVMQTMNMQFGNGGLGDRAVFLRVKYLHAVIAHVEVAFAVLAY